MVTMVSTIFRAKGPLVEVKVVHLAGREMLIEDLQWMEAPVCVKVLGEIGVCPAGGHGPGQCGKVGILVKTWTSVEGGFVKQVLAKTENLKNDQTEAERSLVWGAKEVVYLTEQVTHCLHCPQNYLLAPVGTRHTLRGCLAPLDGGGPHLPKI